MEFAAQMISQLGFPIFVATYLMVSFGQKLDKFVEEFRKFRVIVVTLVKVMDQDLVDGIPREILDDISGVTELEDLEIDEEEEN